MFTLKVLYLNYKRVSSYIIEKGIYHLTNLSSIGILAISFLSLILNFNMQHHINLKI